MTAQTCSDDLCYMPAVVLVRDRPWCLADGRAVSGAGRSDATEWDDRWTHFPTVNPYRVNRSGGVA